MPHPPAPRADATAAAALALLGAAAHAHAVALLTLEGPTVLAAWPNERDAGALATTVARLDPHHVREASSPRIFTLDDEAGRPRAAVTVRALDDRHVLAMLGDPPEGEDSHERARLLEHAACTLSRAMDSAPIGDSAARLLEPLAALAAHYRLRPLAQTVCDQVASTFGASRVALGVCRGNAARAIAVDRTMRPTRGTPETQRLEAAMDEALDQEGAVIWPDREAGERSALVTRCARDLAEHHHAGHVAAIPMRATDPRHPDACLVAVWPADVQLGARDLDALHLLCDLVAGRVTERAHHDRWPGARVASMSRDALSGVLGPTHTWAKATAVLLAIALAALAIIPGPIRVHAPATVVPETQRVLTAPRDASLAALLVEPGDLVNAEQRVAVLEANDLMLEAAALEAELAGLVTEAADARARSEAAEVRAAEAAMRRVRAQLDRVDELIAASELASPIDGLVIDSVGRQRLNAPVRAGDDLVTIADTTRLHVEALVDDARLGTLQPGQHAEVSFDAFPGRLIPVTVARIAPAATEVDGRRVVRVELQLLPGDAEGLRPGLEGRVRITTGEAALLVVWTRDVTRWLRLRLWL